MAISSHLESLRMAEIEAIKPLLQPGMKVLELGGGNGYQAYLLSLYGCEVNSIDITTGNSFPQTYYAVQEYDGITIPFPDKCFDVVFSSSVLEHVRNVPVMLAEFRRVLKPNGLAVHVLPNCNWRFWTSVAYYPFLLKYLFLSKQKKNDMRLPSVKGKIESKGVSYLLKRALMPGPHGEYSNAFSELYYFSKRRWARIFREHGFDLVKIMGNNIFYTGYGIFPGLSLSVRQKLANYLGSSCFIYVMRSK